jgi:hypothetical protein
MGPLAFLGDLWTLAAFSDSGGTLAPSHEDDRWCGELLFSGGFRRDAGASFLTIDRCLSASRRLGSAGAH